MQGILIWNSFKRRMYGWMVLPDFNGSTSDTGAVINIKC